MSQENVGISDRNEAHCSHYVVVDIQGGHALGPAICQPGDNRKNQDVCALGLGAVRRAWGQIKHAVNSGSFERWTMGNRVSR